MGMERTKHDGISLLKGICCIIILFLHVPLPGVVGDAIAIGCEFAVPIFFMITGYFIHKKQDVKWMLRKIKGLVILLVLSEMVAAVSDLIIECVINKTNFEYWFLSSNIVQHPIRLILFGTAFNGSLWFLYALIYVYLFYILLTKYDLLKNKYFYIIGPLLYVIMVLGRLFVQNLFSLTDENVYLFRNFLLPAFPMTLLGSWFSYKSEAIEKIGLLKRLLVVLIGLAIMPLEYFFYKKIFKNPGMEHCFFTIILAFGIFACGIFFTKVKQNPLKYIGEKHYTLVYVLHVPVVWWVNIFLDKINLTHNAISLWIRPFVVLLMCLLIGEIVAWLKKIIKKEDK